MSNIKSSEIRDILHFLEMRVHEKHYNSQGRHYLFTALLFLDQTSLKKSSYLIA